MEVLLVLEGIGFVLSFLVVLWSFRKVKNQTIRMLVIIMLALFVLSSALSFSSAQLNDWIAHVPFYGGQLVLFLLVKELISEYGRKREAASWIIGGGAYFGVNDWISYLTDQGIQDILTLPLTILAVVYVGVRFQYIENKSLKKALVFFLLGASSLTMVYVINFFVEAQGVLPFLSGLPIQIIGFVLFYISLFLFALGIGKLAYQQ